MPWTSQDAQRHDSKASTTQLQKQWSKVANDVLRRTGNEANAVRIANGVIKKHEGRVK